MESFSGEALGGLFLVISGDMPSKKPSLVVATFCEKVLQERDGVLSVIRIVDTYYVSPLPEPLRDGVPAIDVHGLVALKSGGLVGNFTAALVYENSKGERTLISPEGGWPVVFKGEEHGLQIRLEFRLGVENFGLVWFDVLFDDEILTRIPLRLRPLAEKQESPSSQTNAVLPGAATS